MSRKPEEEISKIIELYNTGLSAAKVGEIVGLSQATIHKHLKRRGLARPKRKPQEEINKIVELYNTGLSTAGVGKVVGLAPQTVRKHLLRRGVVRSKSEAAKAAYKTREHHWNWKGGRSKHNLGYVYVKVPDHLEKYHEKVTFNGYALEHIVVWEQAHGMALPDGMVIHHLNGIKDDNRLENLVAMKRGEHHQLAEPYKRRIHELELELRGVRVCLAEK